MKYVFLSTLSICSLSFFSSCKEVGPDINLHGNANSVSDTTYLESPVATAAAKNVLIEEFTGVQCPNCPAGHAVVDGIEAQYPGRIAAIALHPNNSLGRPFPFSLQNLITASSTSLLAYLADPSSEPCAGVDRQLFQGQTYILTDRNSWPGFVQSEIVLTPQVNIILSDQFNAATSQLNVIAEVHYTQNVSQPNNITIALTEDSIVTAQLNGFVIDTFYTHNNVLRNILTSTEGDNVAYNSGVTLVAGRVVRLVYQTTLNSLWKPQNMHIVAFVHEHASSQVVYQASIIKLTN